MKNFINILCICLCMLCLTACRSVPFTGRKQMLLTSRKYKNQLGEAAWKQIKSQNRISRNKEQTAMVERTGQAIAKVANQKDFDWEFLVFESKTANAFCLPYSRAHEYEADYLGMIYMAKAGYDPRAAITFWKKFGKVSKTSGMEEYLSTHPLSDKRIEEMQRRLPEVLEKYYKLKNR